MKKIIISFIYFATILLALSCTSRVKDVFDDSAAQRTDKEIAKYEALLVEPEEGWIMEYYPSPTQAYGGFSIAIKFGKDGTVTAASDFTDDPSETVKSLYSIKKDMGPALSFDTYNSIIHYMSDPDKPIGEGQGAGLRGDYEFIFEQSSSDEIILKGKKTKNVIRMFKVTESGLQYLSKIRETRESFEQVIAVEGVEGKIFGASASGSFKSAQVLSMNIGDTTVTAAFRFVPGGIKFYKPFVVSGKEVQEFSWDAKDQRFVAADKNISDTYLDIQINKDYSMFLGTYDLHYNGSEVIEVKIEPGSSISQLVLKGFPYDVILIFNKEKKNVELKAQTIAPNAVIAIWQVSAPGYLSYASNPGLISSIDQNQSTLTFTMVDNDADWVDPDGNKLVARGYILWNTQGGEYTQLGYSRVYDMKFVKK